MSVRMALAKLCACACGGALVGGGAVHVAENPTSYGITKRIVPKKRVARQETPRPTKRLLRNPAVATAACPPPVVTVAGAPEPSVPPPVYVGSSGDVPIAPSGGSSGPVVVGGTGGGGFYGGGFFGGGGFVGGTSTLR